jgi:hypothetical protein
MGVTKQFTIITSVALNHALVQLTALAGSNVYFDLDSDGFAERTGWVSASDGLLVRDNNGNGIIDNGSELFGTSTRNGFEVLRALDSNDNDVSEIGKAA